MTIKHLTREESDGTSLKGFLPLDTTYASLEKVLGQPDFTESGDNKVKCEWIIETPFGVATIYDYKSSVDCKDNTDWHIGGHTDEVAGYVNGLIQ